MRDLQEILDALRSPIRREILALIWDQERPAGEIAAAFEVGGPTISQHLRVLRDTGLVSVQVDANFRRYRANQEALRGLHTALWGDSPKWLPADDLPEVDRARTRTGRAVRATVDVPTDQATTFAAFTDPIVYSRWLGAPVAIDDGRFACTLEWGTRIRGRYDIVAPPSLIALRWDFEDDDVPVPGGELTGYLRFAPAGDGCRVEVHQLCDTAEQAEFMEVAWAMVLGRLFEGVAAAVDPTEPPRPRPSRPKRARRRAPATPA